MNQNFKENSSLNKNEFIPKAWVALKQGYSLALFKADLIAGVTVGIVALPLSMAFAIASGLPPIVGLYTAIIAGLLISLFGGGYTQIGGPAGAFIVVVYEIIQANGYEGLVVVTLLAGVFLLIAAFSRFGSLIKYIPYPIIIGFTAGIAVVIFSLQINSFLGLKIDPEPNGFISKWSAIFSNLSQLNLATFYVGLGTLLTIIGIKKFIPKIPWGIGSIVISGVVCWVFKIPVETIATRYGQIPRKLPVFHLPHLSLFFSKWPALIPDALTIAFLIAISSLLSAVVADGMTGRRHKSNCELMGQGIANIICVLFGGMPATGAVARTATNIKAGGKTPIAGVLHSLTLLAVLLLFAPVVSQVPLTSLAAVLIVVSWNMSQAYHFLHLFKSPAGDIIILLTTFILTIFVDLTVGVGAGMIIASFIFIKRVGDSSKIGPIPIRNERDVEELEANLESIAQKDIPKGVEIYEIAGPFFFGLADSLKDVLTNLEKPPKAFILRMRKVPTIDASGLHALKEFYLKCKRDKTHLILSGVQPEVLQLLDKYELTNLIREEMIFHNFDKALKKATELSK